VREDCEKRKMLKSNRMQKIAEKRKLFKSHRVCKDCEKQTPPKETVSEKAAKSDRVIKRETKRKEAFVRSAKRGERLWQQQPKRMGDEKEVKRRTSVMEPSARGKRTGLSLSARNPRASALIVATAHH
jgi:hypothetical protein